MKEDNMHLDQLKRQMIDKDLKGRDITSKRVLNAFDQVPRHLFVPEALKNCSYEDYPLSIGEEQTISQPYIVALMTQALDLKNTHHVLEIGTGSGFQTAILSVLAKEIYTVEIREKLQKKAQMIHETLRLNNIHYFLQNGFLGLASYAPYDRIMVTAAPDHIPDSLIDQLKENGIMIIPLGNAWFQQLMKITKTKGTLKKEVLCHCRFVQMTP
jgi:protein-L-isoaspartate(D-aspartate) O-methyltransferase